MCRGHVCTYICWNHCVRCRWNFDKCSLLSVKGVALRVEQRAAVHVRDSLLGGDVPPMLPNQTAAAADESTQAVATEQGVGQVGSGWKSMEDGCVEAGVRDIVDRSDLGEGVQGQTDLFGAGQKCRSVAGRCSAEAGEGSAQQEAAFTQWDLGLGGYEERCIGEEEVEEENLERGQEGENLPGCGQAEEPPLEEFFVRALQAYRAQLACAQHGVEVDDDAVFEAFNSSVRLTGHLSGHALVVRARARANLRGCFLRDNRHAVFMTDSGRVLLEDCVLSRNIFCFWTWCCQPLGWSAAEGKGGYAFIENKDVPPHPGTTALVEGMFEEGGQGGEEGGGPGKLTEATLVLKDTLVVVNQVLSITWHAT